MKIGALGAGTWGFALTSLLARKGYTLTLWTREEELAKELSQTREHPKLPGFPLPEQVQVTTNLEEAVTGCDLIFEAVTSGGIRPVCEQIQEIAPPQCPFIITSKGIEQGSGLLLAEVVISVFGEEFRSQVGCLCGPSHAEEVVKSLPTSVVASAYEAEVIEATCRVFNGEAFRVYPNLDVMGVMFGAALKNVIAVACGISDGLGYGDNTKAILMTRGLHEIRKLAMARGADPATLNGLAGMGDLCVTCMSTLSRNYRFGRYFAEGCTPEEAEAKVGMVVEGAYNVVSARELGLKAGIPLPITEMVYRIIVEGLPPREAVETLMQRPIKEEKL